MLIVETEKPSVEALGDEIASLAAHISAATCRWLALIAQFDERLGWAEAGARSCAAWISWRCGVSPGTAREHVRVARRLEELPLVQAAFAAGRLSYSKARALTRIEAIRDEAELVELARHADAAQLERIVGAFRGVTTEQAEAGHEERRLECFADTDGTLHIKGRLPAELGAVLMAALRAAEEQLGGDPDTMVPAAARRADALVLLAQAATADTASLSDDGAPRLSPQAVELTLQVDAGTLTTTTPAETPTCGIEHGAALAAETVRRLCCDAGIVPVVQNADGDVLSVGRRTRSIPPAIRRALTVRDEGCRFPGCGRTRWLHAHHLEHWAHGGRTELANLVLLCSHHHRLVHEGGWRLIVSEGMHAVDALAPDGHHVLAIPPQPAVHAASVPGAASPPRPDAPGPQSLYPQSAGAPWDLGMAVDAVLSWTDD